MVPFLGKYMVLVCIYECDKIVVTVCLCACRWRFNLSSYITLLHERKSCLDLSQFIKVHIQYTYIYMYIHGL